jgi:outer membrane receptor protein involved in Fe transport
MPLAPNRTVHSGIEIYLPYHLTVKPEMRYVGDAFLSGDSDNNAEKLDSYTLFDFYLFFKPKVNKLNISAFAGIENIADKMYSSFGIDYEQYSMPNFYYPMPGRIFKAGISLEF